MKKRNLETVKIKLTYLLYLIIVHTFVLARNIIRINMYTTILIHAFLILFGVEGVFIYVIPMICHNSEYRVTRQLLKVFICMSIQLRNLIPEPVNEFSHVFIC
jgi:hypothetical protein